VAGCVLALAGYAVLLLPRFSSYLSFKILAYGAPFLVLLAVGAVAHISRRARLVAYAVMAVFLVPSATVATVRAVWDARTRGSVAGVEAVAAELPRDAIVSVALDDAWEQGWAIYYLRDQPLSIDEASYLLTGQGIARPRAAYRHGPVSYRFGRLPGGDAVWRDGELALVRTTAAG
jgi:hypothetical protein